MVVRIAMAAACSLAVACLAPGVAAAEEKITISKRDCARLLRHQPRPDVAYQPGMDHKGRKVAPADLPGSGGAALPNLVPEVIEIPLSVMPMSGKAYATHGLGDSQMSLGSVKYDMGRNSFTLNGQPLGDRDQQALADACAKRGVK
ncbi:hypothetical protein [Magnetospirillum sp. UT-4]|uniref:hypothetical protein n=1 Tax=Magnetospirillum sp. UT-4 TaxID=2681467 RepID=UPI001384AE46|nr:hypothetical protein [Magnetospirillum sp. UT-4]CAA7617742.1 conserved exported hypothetical protein [Magnetospirillum sp. UT-4]